MPKVVKFYESGTWFSLKKNHPKFTSRERCESAQVILSPRREVLYQRLHYKLIPEKQRLTLWGERVVEGRAIASVAPISGLAC